MIKWITKKDMNAPAPFPPYMLKNPEVAGPEMPLVRVEVSFTPEKETVFNRRELLLKQVIRTASQFPAQEGPGGPISECLVN